MITVHHLENSRSQRVLWLLEELKVDYEIRRYERNPKTSLAPPELKKVHPLGKSPVITDGEITVAETGAIVEYLIGKYGNGRLIPADGTPERLRYTYWLHAAEGTIMPYLLILLIFNRIETQVPFFIRPIAKTISGQVKSAFLNPNIQSNLAYMEAELGKSKWFAGDELSGADIQMSYPVEGATARAGLGATYPRLLAFLDAIHARPAYQKALERGGPYSIGG